MCANVVDSAQLRVQMRFPQAWAVHSSDNVLQPSQGIKMWPKVALIEQNCPFRIRRDRLEGIEQLQIVERKVKRPISARAGQATPVNHVLHAKLLRRFGS
jgi:hypothetical protein